MQKYHFYFHLVCYYLAWISCVHLAAHHYAWWSTAIVIALVSIQLMWQIFVAEDTKSLYIMIILLTIVGSLMDTLYLRTGLIVYQANPFFPYFCPPWMIAIWLSFAMTYDVLLKHLFSRYILLGVLSLVGFSFAYYIGAEMAAIFFTHGLLTCIIVGLTWSITLPSCMLFYNSITRSK